MAQFYLRMKYQDSLALTAGKELDMGDFDQATDGEQYEAALGAAAQLVASMDGVTAANKIEYIVYSRPYENSQVPAGDVRVADQAVLSLHLNQPTERPKLATFIIPAADNAIFLADGKTVDVNSSLLSALTTDLAQHALISDGETVVTASGTNGIDSGYRRMAKKSTKRR